ncbi:MAG TPA: HAMP domain-containing sensor histidine kinase [Polyangiaceae bacterium]|nr:HAMP domain-containing sensor histidine kinase [Polyangiaceae bacterium]
MSRPPSKPSSLPPAADEAGERGELSLSLSTFATSLAHELNNPLSSVLMSVQYARTTSDAERLSKLLATIEENTRRCSQIVERMVELARRSSSELGPAPLDAVLSEAVELARRQGVTVELELGALPAVRCQIGELRQAFVMLLLGLGREGTRVRVRARRSGQLALVELEAPVQTDGAAQRIDSALGQRLFADRDEQPAHLAIARRIVGAYGGSIRPAHVEGWTRLEVQLPETSGAGPG